MSVYTDADIPICCAECSPDTYFEGLEAMTAHILEVHKAYDPLEAKVYAELWMESAYERDAEEMADYYQDRQIQRQIDHALGKD